MLLVMVGVVRRHVRRFDIHRSLRHVGVATHLRSMSTGRKVLWKYAAVGEHHSHSVPNFEDFGVWKNLVLVPGLEKLDEFGLECIVNRHKCCCHYSRQILDFF